MNKIVDIKTKEDCKKDWVLLLQVTDDKVHTEKQKSLAEWSWY